MQGLRQLSGGGSGGAALLKILSTEQEAHGWATGTRLWVRHKTEAWAAAMVIKNEKVPGKKDFSITIEDADHALYKFIHPDNLSETEDMKMLNSKTNSGIDNLVDLVVLNEPEMLHCLQSRYKEDKIYTNTGPILIALNPFKPLPALYNKDVLEFYYNFGMARSNFLLQQVVVPEPPPHVYAIADKAYRSMMAGVESDFSGKVSSAHDQSILISGESGAGKTESTKLIMQYVTIISSASREVTDKSSVMDRVLLSNPILESVGNAKTLRNNNSSRFGKYIELKFDKAGFLLGGFIQTYMLEKVRVVSQQPGERNYHIFYQMGAGGSEAQRSRWGISNVQSFLYANQGKVSSVAGIDDRKGFSELINAFDAFEVAKGDQESLMDVMAALLHIGQFAFAADGDGEGSVVDGRACAESLARASTLLGVTSEKLCIALTSKTIAFETTRKPLTVTQASDARDAIVKAVYSSFFDWLVAVINKQLVETSDGLRAQIGILDIFGFEFFKYNSLEQLCINYANEALQQHFNSFVFEFEQKEYREEGIEWSFVEFKNNKKCLELIDMKGAGIFSMTDDECFIPKGSDQNLAGRFYKDLMTNSSFSATAAQKSNLEFTVWHYACPVTYCTRSFMEKNKNEVPQEALDLLVLSRTALVVSVFAAAAAPAAKDGKKSFSRARSTVCSQFKDQLADLLRKIDATASHYVRTIKPNDSMQAALFDRMRIVEQLKSNGALEAIRLSRAGYPYRMRHQDFYSRYRPILTPDRAKKLKISLPKSLLSSDKENGELCMLLLETLQKLLGGRKPEVLNTAQSGRTKVFMTKEVYDVVEGGRARLVHASLCKIQALARCSRYTRWYARAKVGCRTIQRLFRNSRLRMAVARRVEAARIKLMEKKIFQNKRELERLEKERTERERVYRETMEAQEPALATTSSDAAEAALQTAQPEAARKSVKITAPVAAAVEKLVAVAAVTPRPVSVRVTAEAVEVQKKEAARLSLIDRVAEGQRQLEELRRIRKIKERDAELLLARSEKQAQTAPKATEDMSIGPRRYDTYGEEAMIDMAVASAPEPSGESSDQVGAAALFKKDISEKEKEEYKQQFPSAWSTTRVLRFFQRSERSSDSTASESSLDSIKESAHGEKDYISGPSQVKLLRVLERVAGRSSGSSIAVFEGQVIADGKRCFLRHFTVDTFIDGGKEDRLSRLLLFAWKAEQDAAVAKPKRKKVVPIPVIIGTFRSPQGLPDSSTVARWKAKFSETEFPLPGDLWLVYAWDRSSFKSLLAFTSPQSLQAINNTKLSRNQTIAELKHRFFRSLLSQCVDALALMHGAGFCHCSLTAESIWLQTFELNDAASLHVKFTNLHRSQKIGDLGVDSVNQVESDIECLGFVMLDVLIFLFSSKSKGEFLEIANAISKVNVSLAKSLIKTDRLGHNELEQIFDEICKGDSAEFYSFIASIPSWRNVLAILKDSNSAVGNLLMRMVSGGAVSSSKGEPEQTTKWLAKTFVAARYADEA